MTFFSVFLLCSHQLSADYASYYAGVSYCSVSHEFLVFPFTTCFFFLIFCCWWRLFFHPLQSSLLRIEQDLCTASSGWRRSWQLAQILEQAKTTNHAPLSTFSRGNLFCDEATALWIRTDSVCLCCLSLSSYCRIFSWSDFGHHCRLLIVFYNKNMYCVRKEIIVRKTKMKAGKMRESR